MSGCHILETWVSLLLKGSSSTRRSADGSTSERATVPVGGLGCFAADKPEWEGSKVIGQVRPATR
jgi:hypothetical protein